MSAEQIKDRILLDARKEAEAIVATAQQKAEKLRAEAVARAESLADSTKVEMASYRKNILEKKAAAARLDSAKLLLGEKRKVIDTIYNEVYSRLLALSKEDSVRLLESLLELYAEEGDELCFAENYPYVADIEILPIVAEKGLRISNERLPLDGGIRLKGEQSDKDLSFGAIMAADRERNQASLAKELFK